jgi:deoxyguanosine kinase
MMPGSSWSNLPIIPFLPKFYENPKQYAFPLELFFMAERFKQLKEFIQQQKDLFQSVTISDYLFIKCLLFAKVTLPKMNSVFTSACSTSFISSWCNPISSFIFMHRSIGYRLISASVTVLMSKTFQTITCSISRKHIHIISSSTTPKHLFVDASEADFLGNEKHVQAIIDALDKEYTEGQHYISLP